MDKWSSCEEVLDFAIGEEERSEAFYRALAETANPAMKKVFEGFATEEAGHKKLLQRVKRGDSVVVPDETVQDLRVSDYVVELEPKPDMTYDEALVVAMHREKAAFKLYNSLAALVNDDEVKRLLLGIAQEEAKHKLRFEVEYDELADPSKQDEARFSGCPPNLADGNVS